MLLKFRALHLFSGYSEHTARVIIEGVGELETKVTLSPQLVQQIQDEVLKAFAESPKGNQLGKVLTNAG